MSFRKTLLGISGIILTFGMIAVAQQPQTTTTAPDGTLKRDRLERREKARERMDGTRRGGRDGLGPGGLERLRLMRGIELTDQQRQQSRAIMQRRLESTKAQREELFKLKEKRIAGTFSPEDEARAKALHQEMRTAMEGARTEMEGLLTAEQKAQIEQLRVERKAQREQRMRERQELRNKPQ